jgi:uncharacterized protein YjbI with pentapeptide repeats
MIIEAVEHQDATIWNTWREDAKIERPNLKGADLSNVVLQEVNLMVTDLTGVCLQNATISASFDYAVLNKANLRGACMHDCRFNETQLVEADCRECDFSSSQIVASNFSLAQLQKAAFKRCDLEDTVFDWADLSDTNFYQADLFMASLKFATLRRTNFVGANLNHAHLTGAQLTECNLRRTLFIDSDIRETTIKDCAVYGVAAWRLKRDEFTCQRNLRVSDDDEAPLFVDDIEVAQFINLMVHNPRIREVIDTISRKGVLILGRFTAERKLVLDAIRDKLRSLGFVPVLFDFEQPSQRDFEETIKILAGLSRFVIADITNPSSSPLEIHATVPDYMIPFVPLIKSNETPFSMFEGLQQKYWWVLDTLEYPSSDALTRALENMVIAPALEMEQRITETRAKSRPIRRLPE